MLLEEEAFQEGIAVKCLRKPLACQLASQPEDFKRAGEMDYSSSFFFTTESKKKETSNHSKTLILILSLSHSPIFQL